MVGSFEEVLELYSCVAEISIVSVHKRGQDLVR